MIGAINHGKGISRGIIESKMELAILGIILDSRPRSNIGLEAVKAKCDNLPFLTI